MKILRLMLALGTLLSLACVAAGWLGFYVIDELCNELQEGSSYRYLSAPEPDPDELHLTATEAKSALISASKAIHHGVQTVRRVSLLATICATSMLILFIGSLIRTGYVE